VVTAERAVAAIPKKFLVKPVQSAILSTHLFEHFEEHFA
jgi:hypothetical protein